MHARQFQALDKREESFRSLFNSESPLKNHYWLTKIMASWLDGGSALPDYLGLEPLQFEQLTGQYFSGHHFEPTAPSGVKIDSSRMLEKDDLVRLLNQYCVVQEPESNWLIELLVAGCMGSDHLWQDMGFWQRSDLTNFLQQNFPDLAVKNNKDMKWKKFLYKQLCEAEGIYLCRAPSCEVCKDFSDCFGSEE